MFLIFGGGVPGFLGSVPGFLGEFRVFWGVFRVLGGVPGFLGVPGCSGVLVFRCSWKYYMPSKFVVVFFFFVYIINE